MGRVKPDAELVLQNKIIALFAQLGYETADCFYEICNENNPVGRTAKTQVVLTTRLHAALEDLNPELPLEAIEDAIEELTRDRSIMSPTRANSEIYQLLKDGVPVNAKNEKGEEEPVKVKVIDWKEPRNNKFFLASEFWIQGDLYERRADLIGFVNGLPLIFIELKAPTVNVKQAYNKNLTDYRDTIPKIFWYNAFIILSNGTQAVIGSTTAQWEHFTTWKWVSDGSKLVLAQGETRLETMIQGTCEKGKLLDIVENFTLFKQDKHGLIKLVAKSHQYLGVNNAIETVRQIQSKQGRLGVFWHTQGSGKSYSMQFFSQKILRKIPGAKGWTFVVVTDREDLDSQIYKYFADTGAVTEPEEQIRAQDGEHLKKLLKENPRYVFTLIQKFHAKKGRTYEELSDRYDIIVMVDEAHRSQYDTFAENMRNALPRASFIGFTGTPLIQGEDEETRRKFGEYVSIYNFKQSIEDEATVPLYYENRIPEVQLKNEALNDDIVKIIEDYDLDEAQEQKLSQKFVNEYEVITRPGRLETIAKDIVTHFMTRGYQGKAMVVSIDRFTAVKMYDKVRHYWQEYLERLKAQLANANEFERKKLSKQIQYMEETDMAVVVSLSHSQNEIKEFKEEGLDIRPHRDRLIKEDLEEKFKNETNPLRIVFVCAMWMTGFDVPSCSTIYLDKPMKNHTLMQTITRANRVFRDKASGLIVDYIGVFQELRKALQIYGSSSDKRIKQGEYPIEDKLALIDLLRKEIEKARKFCQQRGVDVDSIINSEGFQRFASIQDAAIQLTDAEVIEPLDDSIEKIIVNDDLKREFVFLAGNLVRIYRAIVPFPTDFDKAEKERLEREKSFFAVLADKICSFQTEETDISAVEGEMKDLLDQSITPVEYIIKAAHHTQLIDLSQLDIEKLQQIKTEFNNTTHKRTQLEKLRGAVNRKIRRMVRLNKKRVNFADKFQQLIDDYNSGSRNVELTFQQLLDLTQDLSKEEKRAIAEGLDEEELALFDLLTKPEITEKEEQQVKKVAKDLLKTLKREKKKVLVANWRQKRQSESAVKNAIHNVLYELPESYSDELYDQVFEAVYQHIFESYYGDGDSIYSAGS